jgi:hypothetical protein
VSLVFVALVVYGFCRGYCKRNVAGEIAVKTEARILPRPFLKKAEVIFDKAEARVESNMCMSRSFRRFKSRLEYYLGLFRKRPR